MLIAILPILDVVLASLVNEDKNTAEEQPGPLQEGKLKPAISDRMQDTGGWSTFTPKNLNWRLHTDGLFQSVRENFLFLQRNVMSVETITN